MSDLHKDFDSEQDLHTQFDAEPSIKTEEPSLFDKYVPNAIKGLIPSAQTLGDLGASAVKGATLGAAIPASAALQASGEKINDLLGQPMGASGDQNLSLIEKYKKYQDLLKQGLEEGHQRHPKSNTVAEIAGGLASGGAILGGLGGAAEGTPGILSLAQNGQKLEALKQLGLISAKSGAIGGALNGVSAGLQSSGGLDTEEGRNQLMNDISSGATSGLETGAVLGPGIKLTGEAITPAIEGISNYAKKIPFARQNGVMWDYGQKGINPKSETELLNTGPTSITKLDNQRATALTQEIQAAHSRLGKAVGDSLINADKTFTEQNKFINIDPDTRQALQQIQDLATKYPEIVQNPRAQQIYEKISSANPDVLPSEAKTLLDYMDSYIDKFSAATNKTPSDKGILSSLNQTRRAFSNTLKQQVPEYGVAADRFNQFNTLVPETLLAGSRSPQVTDLPYGKPSDQELFDKLKPIIQGTTRQGSENQPIRENFTQFIGGAKDFEAQDAARLANGQVSQPAFDRPVSDIEKQIKQWSDDAVARNSMDALEPRTSGLGVLKQAATGLGSTGRSMVLSGTNFVSRQVKNISDIASSKNPVATLSRNIYNAPTDAVQTFARTLQDSPGLEKYGNNLSEALQSTDADRRNQVLFTIMQNPAARKAIGGGEKNQDTTQSTYNLPQQQ
jgi:molecular chaperone GrpE (heat shock protein)